MEKNKLFVSLKPQLERENAAYQLYTIYTMEHIVDNNIASLYKCMYI